MLQNDKLASKLNVTHTEQLCVNRDELKTSSTLSCGAPAWAVLCSHPRLLRSRSIPCYLDCRFDPETKQVQTARVLVFQDTERRSRDSSKQRLQTNIRHVAVKNSMSTYICTTHPQRDCFCTACNVVFL